MLKSLIKRVLYRIAPRWTTERMSAQARAHSHGVSKQWGCDVIADLMFARLGDRVLEGPFEGIRLTEATKSEHIAPYLLGTYESELEPAWNVILEGRYDRIVDIGAKFGYYAIGLARRFPEAVVTAFDTDVWARDATRRMMQANGVENVRVESYCDPASLAAAVSDRSFVISDCEGYESKLFADEVLKRLQGAVMIIETHDDLVPGVARDLTERFLQSHWVFTIHDRRNRRATKQPLEFLTAEQRALAVSEVRPDQIWLICLPKSGPNADLAQRYQAMEA